MESVGGENTSIEFEKNLKAEGVRHELTIPKTPEPNGVAERMNRTLVETFRSMLADGKLPHRIWAGPVTLTVWGGGGRRAHKPYILSIANF